MFGEESRSGFFGNERTLLAQSRAVFYIAVILHLAGWFTYALEAWVLLIYIPIVLLAIMAIWAIMSKEFRVKPTPAWLKLLCIAVAAYVTVLAAIALYHLKDGFPVFDTNDGQFYAQLGSRKTGIITEHRYEYLKRAAYLFTTSFAPLITLFPLCYFRQCRSIAWNNNYFERDTSFHRHHHHHHHVD